MKTKTRRSTPVGEMDRKTERWAAGLRLGLAIAERADLLARVARIQFLDANGAVLFTAAVDAISAEAARAEDA